MDSDLAQKIEKLEAQFLYWEKGVFAACGAALTMLGGSAVGGFEKSYLDAAFKDTAGCAARKTRQRKCSRKQQPSEISSISEGLFSKCSRACRPG